MPQRAGLLRSSCLRTLGMEDKLEGRKELIAGINHMGWLLEIKDRERRRPLPRNQASGRPPRKTDPEMHTTRCAYEYIQRFGYYCTESSEHNAEYNMFYIKSKYPELIERYQHSAGRIPPPLRQPDRRLEAKEYAELLENGVKVDHERSREYASHIMEAIVTGAAL